LKNIKNLIKTSLLAGIITILPIAVLIGAFSWIFKTITGLIQPLTHLFFGKSEVEIIGNFIVLTIILLMCFLLGLAVKTGIGSFIQNTLEKSILQKIFGYSLVKETILQFIGNKKSPFSSVALVNIYCNDTLVTAFITDEHDDDSFTVFVPTGPNPTSGNIFHLKSQFVHKIDVSIEDTMRSIISCGSGSNKLIKKFIERN
jgi:uncharacterized membrane protein